jgi:glyoxylase-like metal-dependent hydrolase (beta-lactamase superfamily II)
MQIRRVADMEGFRVPAARGFPDLTREMLSAHATRLGPALIDPATLELILSFHTYVVRTARHLILVDTCIGDGKHRTQRPNWHQRRTDFLERLAAAGAKPEDVDVVLCTHLHADHVGWNTQRVDGRWVPTFPNARYVMAETEYRHWRDQYDRLGSELLHGSFADSVLPVVERGQAEMVSMSHRVESGVYLEPAVGHTPGTVLIHAEDDGEHGVFCGDIIHHPIQFAYPAMHTSYCEDPAQSARTRVALCERYADTPTRLFTAHFPAPSTGRILRDGRAFRFASVPGAGELL